jgi:P-type conjugative transfer protein TrbL
MWFLTFWVVLIYGPTWAIAIVHSLQNIGGTAAGVASLSPENILKIGSDVSGTLLTGAGEFGFLSGEWAVGFARLFAALATWFSFVTIAIQYTILLVLWFVAGSLGSIFLGFGGSRWTAAYTERFFTLAISIGIKFLTLMFIVGIGTTFGPVLLAAAASASGAASPGSAALEIVTISGLFALCAWQVPKIFATAMTGTPAFGASELWAGVRGMVAATMTAAAAVGAVTSGVNAGVNALASAGSNALAGIGGAAGHSGGSTDPGTVTSAGSGNVPPPGGGAGGIGGASPSGGGGSNGSSAVWTGPGSEAWAQAQAAAGAGSSGANIDGSAPAGDAGSGGTDSGDSGGSSSGGSAGAAGGGGSRAATSQAWRQARMRAQRAGYYAQQTLSALSNDGGHAGAGGPSLRIG